MSIVCVLAVLFDGAQNTPNFEVFWAPSFLTIFDQTPSALGQAPSPLFCPIFLSGYDVFMLPPTFTDGNWTMTVFGPGQISSSQKVSDMHPVCAWHLMCNIIVFSRLI